ncbi:MAG: transcriptional regulator [Planctomycetes bacterium RBG_16_64_10]|nr:MAG: transcriptional regulator [Planctomycetes bacterium RBG_16_64_10]
MTESFRGVQPTQSQLPGDIQQLVAAVDALPAEHRDRMLPMVARVLESNRRRRRILNLVQEAISQLRLDMKYLVFDLEATRRERESLRHQLEEGDA